MRCNDDTDDVFREKSNQQIFADVLLSGMVQEWEGIEEEGEVDEKKRGREVGHEKEEAEEQESVE